jgi:hypothetical protein
MADYTPTIEEVREAYRKTLRKVEGVYSLVLPEDADAAFDRWLEAERLAERERIIALLEEEYALAVKYDFEIVHGLHAAIALIKGEQPVSANPDTSVVSEKTDKKEEA